MKTRKATGMLRLSLFTVLIISAGACSNNTFESLTGFGDKPSTGSDGNTLVGSDNPIDSDSQNTFNNNDSFDGSGSTTDSSGSTTDSSGSTTDGSGSTTDGSGSTTDGSGSTSDGSGSTSDGEVSTGASTPDSESDVLLQGSTVTEVDTSSYLSSDNTLKESGGLNVVHNTDSSSVSGNGFLILKSPAQTAGVYNLVWQVDIRLLSGSGYGLMSRVSDNNPGRGNNFPDAVSFQYDPGLNGADNGLRLVHYPSDRSILPNQLYAGIGDPGSVNTGWMRVRMSVIDHTLDNKMYYRVEMAIFDKEGNVSDFSTVYYTRFEEVQGTRYRMCDLLDSANQYVEPGESCNVTTTSQSDGSIDAIYTQAYIEDAIERGGDSDEYVKASAYGALGLRLWSGSEVELKNLKVYTVE